MAYYICKYDGVFVEWNGLSVYLTQKMQVSWTLRYLYSIELFSKVDINFKEFDGINNETSMNLLPLWLYKIILSSLQDTGT